MPEEREKRKELEDPSALERTASPVAAGVLALISAVVSIYHPFIGAGLSALSAAAATVSSEQNQARLVRMFNEKLKTVDATKFDQSVCESDEFVQLAFQAVEAAARTASKKKCRALANALISAITLPTSQYRGKGTILRVIDQMQEDELLVLAMLCQLEDKLEPNDERHITGIHVSEIAQRLGMGELDTIAICEGLLQLALVLDGSLGLFDNVGRQHQLWLTTTLARRVAQYAADQAAASSLS